MNFYVILSSQYTFLVVSIVLRNVCTFLFSLYNFNNVQRSIFKFPKFTCFHILLWCITAHVHWIASAMPLPISFRCVFLSHKQSSSIFVHNEIYCNYINLTWDAIVCCCLLKFHTSCCYCRRHIISLIYSVGFNIKLLIKLHFANCL